jgi:hypothetical protein
MNSKYADNLFLFEKTAAGVSCEKHVIYDGPNSFTKNSVKYIARKDFSRGTGMQGKGERKK